MSAEVLIFYLVQGSSYHPKLLLSLVDWRTSKLPNLAPSPEVSLAPYQLVFLEVRKIEGLGFLQKVEGFPRFFLDFLLIIEVTKCITPSSRKGP